MRSPGREQGWVVPPRPGVGDSWDTGEPFPLALATEMFLHCHAASVAAFPWVSSKASLFDSG